MQIQSLMKKIDGHLASFIDTIIEQHDQLVTITKTKDSLYKYTHENFLKLAINLLNSYVKNIMNFCF